MFSIILSLISIWVYVTGPHGQTELHIIDGNSKGHFELQKQFGSLHVLRVSSRARFQRGTEYNLTLKAIDHGIPQKSSQKSLKIYVKEINEHKPKFAREKFEIEISESALPGSSVLIVSAQDLDPNADLTYEIVEPILTRFKIQAKSGFLTTNQDLDREVESVADLRIKVSDGVYEAFTQVVIKVEDVNDQVPKFVQDKYSFQVEENFPLRQSFGKVSFQVFWLLLLLWIVSTFKSVRLQSFFFFCKK
jgi:hypothetical protein